jgi:hypothetical protein
MFLVTLYLEVVFTLSLFFSRFHQLTHGKAVAWDQLLASGGEKGEMLK